MASFITIMGQRPKCFIDLSEKRTVWGKRQLVNFAKAHYSV